MSPNFDAITFMNKKNLNQLYSQCGIVKKYLIRNCHNLLNKTFTGRLNYAQVFRYQIASLKKKNQKHNVRKILG